jgi:predicted nucleic acid-binding protein
VEPLTLDASVLIGLLDTQDAHHNRAVNDVDQADRDHRPLWTPASAYHEALIAFARVKRLPDAREAIAAMGITAPPLTAAIAERAAELRARHDVGWVGTLDDVRKRQTLAADPRATNRVRRATLTLAVLAVLAAALITAGAAAASAWVAHAAAVSGSGPGPYAPATPSALPAADREFGPFAGENWDGHPRAVTGMWRVPRILSGSRQGLASTWIAAQAQGRRGSSIEGPFIQVGTNEWRDQSFLGLANAYDAFYSDSALGYHPVSLFPVKPGDTMIASLALRGHRWIVSIRDLRSGRHVRLTTRDEGRGKFNQAEWLQEDPTVTGTEPRRQFPYPFLSTVRFSHLTVNGAAPRPARLLAAWMNEHNRYLGPGPLIADSFTLAPQTISLVASQYLRITVPFEVVADRFYYQAENWTPATPTVKISAERAAFVAAAQQLSVQLQADAWPASLQPLIVARTQALQDDAAYGQTAPTPTSIREWTHGLTKLAFNGGVGLQLERMLKLPEIVPAPS